MKRSDNKTQLRKISDEYLTAFKDAQECFLTGSAINKAVIPIIHAFAANNIDLRFIEEKMWNLLFKSFSEENVSRKTNIDKLLPVIKCSDHNLLSSTGWIHLYALFLRLGLFHPAYYIRNLAVKVTLEKAKKHEASSTVLMKAILAAIETSDYNLADNYLTLRIKKYGVDYFSNAMYFLITLLKGQYKPTTNLRYIEETNHKDYTDYITGNKIALVGPSETTSSDAKLIDSFERVVRMNYIKRDYCCDGTIKGLKTNISYFAFGAANRIVTSNQMFPDDIDWFVFKDTPDNKILSYYNQKHRSQCSKVRKLQFHYRFCYNGTYNLLPLILLDLLQYFPKEIHVFHSDLYITVTKTIGYDSSEKTKKEIKENKRRSFVHHDPLSQYYLLKKLAALENVTGDLRFIEAINLTAEEYMCKLQEIYL